MKKLFIITKIDKKDKVKREYVTATSRRAPIFKNPEIVKSEIVDIDFTAIEEALKNQNIKPHIIAHVMNVLTTD